jgi:periplasmic protein TonB
VYLLPTQTSHFMAEAGGQPAEMVVLVVGAEEADALLEGAKPKPEPEQIQPVSLTPAPVEPSPAVEVEPQPEREALPTAPALIVPFPDLPTAPVFPEPEMAAVEPPPIPVAPAAPASIAQPSIEKARKTPPVARQPIAKAKRNAPQPVQRANEVRGERGQGEATRTSAAQRRGGTGGTTTTAGSATITSYRSRLVAHLTRYKNYPEQAQERGIGGRNAVTLTLSREGRVISAALSTASGHSLLDSATLAAVRRAQPFPAMPEGGPSFFTVTIGLNYALR